MNNTLILYYDQYHTPLVELSQSQIGAATVLSVDLGRTFDGKQGDRDELPQGWTWRHIDARQEYFTDYLTRAIKANACYQGGYYLSAALSRPILAAICAQHLHQTDKNILVHGFSGNDQLRFEMYIAALCPDVEIKTVAELIGSRTHANAGEFNTSDNLWGCSFEACELSNPARPADLFNWLPEPDGGPVERHVIAFNQGIPIGLDGAAITGVELIQHLNALGHRFGIGVCDLVEDGHIGLKTRAIYVHPAANIITLAHKDLELLVSTRLQNRHKQLVDQEWAELVYQGFWFDPQRASLDAYNDTLNILVTGTVTIELGPGYVRVVARASPNSLYDDDFATHRIGQERGIGVVTQMSRMWSCVMQAAVRRLGQPGDAAKGS